VFMILRHKGGGRRGVSSQAWTWQGRESTSPRHPEFV
jgi:hypothetical protein